MERASFLKSIQQKNELTQFKKLSLQSISVNNYQKTQKSLFHSQSPAFNSQLPAFINRKVKNLKPYTNHFKRFNIQTTKLPDSPQKIIFQNNKPVNNIELQKAKIAKSNLLKQLGICQQIKPTQPAHKMPQICVYEQFLQKTTTMLTSNIIDNMYQNSLKKNAKISKQSYQRSHRQTKPDQQQTINIQKQQRRSLGVNSTQDKQADLNTINSKKSIKSMNQLPKSQEVILKSDKVCIIPNLINIQHQEIFWKNDQKHMATMKKKMSNPISNIIKKQISLNTQFESKFSQKTSHTHQMKQIHETVFISLPKNQETTKKQDVTQRFITRENRIQNKEIISKQSPKKIHNNKILYNFSLSIKQKQQSKAPKTPIGKNNKEEATINVDKNKNKTSTPEIPVPSNVTAFSYIVYQPLFSQNSKLKTNEQNLKNNNKVFGNNRILASLNCKSVVQIASLTKIMTFLLSLQICEKLKIDSNNEKVRIGKFQAGINGTSAQIKEGEIYTVQNLYYGLMLPSGNDASLALAIWGGKKLLIHELKEKQKLKRKTTSQNFYPKQTSEQNNEGITKIDTKKIVLKKKKCYERFILQMNKKARALGMNKTTYANSHGLSNNLNKSCAFDLCILCEYAMLNQKFKKVVSTINYKCSIQYEQISEQTKQDEQKNIKSQKQETKNIQNQLDDIEHQNEHSDEQSTESFDQKEQSSSPRQKRFSISQSNFNQNKEIQLKPVITYGQRQVQWQNTHKLLSKEQYIGIKTGITNTAGPCLASCIKTTQNRCFIIIVLNSKKLNYRFKDTQTLKKWIYKKQKLILKAKQAEQLNQDENNQQQNQQPLNTQTKNCQIDDVDEQN